MLGRKRFFGECYICDNDNATLYFYGYQDGDKERRYECAHCHTEHPECDVGELEADHKYNGTYPPLKGTSEIDCDGPDCPVCALFHEQKEQHEKI